MPELIIQTKKKKEVVDITDEVQEWIASASGPEGARRNDKRDGLVNVFVTHTTAAVTTADLDPGTDLDMLDAFAMMVPQHTKSAPSPNGSGNPNAPIRIKYRHPHDPGHTPDHILSALIGASVTVPVKNGKLVLGTWQRIVLFEFDGPRERRIIVSIN